MTELTRRTFATRILQYGGALSVLTVLNSPRAVWAVKAMEDDAFLQRDDLEHALKSLYMTYDSTTPYPHKFNDALTKLQVRTLDFFMLKGVEKEYAQHYIDTMEPLLRRIKKSVEKEGPEKGLESMFEGTTCSYQLFERITVKEGERSFPCAYKETLENFDKYLGSLAISWMDVCNKWCIPTWHGFAGKIGIKIAIQPGEECRVKLV